MTATGRQPGSPKIEARLKPPEHERLVREAERRSMTVSALVRLQLAPVTREKRRRRPAEAKRPQDYPQRPAGRESENPVAENGPELQFVDWLAERLGKSPLACRVMIVSGLVELDGIRTTWPCRPGPFDPTRVSIKGEPLEGGTRP